MGETRKAHDRRVREGWYDRWTPSDVVGLDIGCEREPVTPTCRRWDLILGDGDAMRLTGVPDGAFGWVYSSHSLEHMTDPRAAIREWWRVLRPGGHLLLSVPHRDLYERRKTLPSRWNDDHKTFWLPETGEPPCTLGLREVIVETLLGSEVLVLRVCDDGWHETPQDVHPPGEYSIEAVVRKPRPGSRLDALAGLVPFREFTEDLRRQQVQHMREDAYLYEAGQPRYVCSLLGALHEELAGRPDLRRIVEEAVWMARRMNDAGTAQNDLDWDVPEEMA